MGGKARSQTTVRRASGVQDAHLAEVLRLLQQMWGEATCELVHDNAYQLLVAAMLSAQSSQRRVNQVTPALFARYPDIAALGRAQARDVEALIRPTGFYRMKAKNLIAMARAVDRGHGGEIPGTMGDLAKLPGVARATANEVLGVWFCESSGVVVDAHVSRVSQRLGLTTQTETREIERDLKALLPRARWIDISHELMWHGRRTCHARNPACAQCALATLCPSAEIEP